MTDVDDLGVPIPSKEQGRAHAADARGLANNPAFMEACRSLQQKYLESFKSLRPDDSDYERRCIRIQVAVNVLPDIVSQLAILADNQKIDDELVQRTTRGNANGRK